MELSVSAERGLVLSALFSEIGVGRVMRLEDELDPQLAFAADVARRWGAGPGSLCSMLTALVSYRLAMRGEDWWRCFRDFFLEHRCPPDPRGAAAAVGEFLRSCKGGVVARDVKLRRLERTLSAGPVLRRLVESPSDVILGDHRGLLSSLAASLGQRPEDKTIVFSLKMAYYACRGTSCPGAMLPADVPIPVDVRVSCASYSSGLVDVPPGVDPVRAIMSHPDVARRAWSTISRSSGVPPLHIDTVIWAVGWAPRELEVDEARAAIHRSLEPSLGPRLAAAVARELTVRACGSARAPHRHMEDVDE
ncbi:MAG: N-glycosylase/DNA lyase [Conexivisphaerales archaeon]|jgi:DNA-(apurinic or apyrimidinic site) lyase|nr:N-glycosylase/DNA lyase [Conexivisphaerales archaeon]